MKYETNIFSSHNLNECILRAKLKSHKNLGTKFDSPLNFKLIMCYPNLSLCVPWGVHALMIVLYLYVTNGEF